MKEEEGSKRSEWDLKDRDLILHGGVARMNVCMYGRYLYGRDPKRIGEYPNNWGRAALFYFYILVVS